MSKFNAVTLALAIASTAAVAQANASELNGRWLINDGTDKVLHIRGNEWIHPAHGGAVLRKGQGAATLDVHYIEHTMRCRYRHHTSEMGDKLILISQDANQNSQFCPTGTFTRIDR